MHTIAMPMMESHGDRFKELMTDARMSRIDATKRLAKEIGYEDDPAKLMASVDAYRAGNRPSIERAKAWDQIFNTGDELVTMWWGVSRPVADEDLPERLSERIDELEARLTESAMETNTRLRRIESALGLPPDGTPT